MYLLHGFKSHVFPAWLIQCFYFTMFLRQINTEVSELREYCHLDTFNASCPHGSVIMMQSARYGRMRIGRCLKTSYYIGCRADVLPHMDRICSGKRSCVIKTVDSELLKYHPCRKDLMPYLEAQFKCITTQHGTAEECVANKRIVVQQASGYMNLRLGHKTHIQGTEVCPWQTSVHIGQRIELTMIRFSYSTENKKKKKETEEQEKEEEEPCQHFLIVKDGSIRREVPLCRSGLREEHLYTSIHSTVQFYIQSEGTVAEHHKKPTVLLHYKPLGCADLEEVPDVEIRRTESTAVIKCKSSTKIFHMVCKENNWIGDLRNCTELTTESTTESEKAISTEFKSKVQYGILIAVSAGLILGVFLGFMLLIGMTFYRKRDKRSDGAETTRQNTLLAEIPDDKGPYSSYAPTNQYSSYIARGATSAPISSTDKVISWQCSCDVGPREVPCDMPCGTQILDFSAPDVLYSPRIAMETVLNTCEACRTNEIINAIYAGTSDQMSPPPLSPPKTTTSFMPLPTPPEPARQKSRNQSSSSTGANGSVYDTLPSTLPRRVVPTRSTGPTTEAGGLHSSTSVYDIISFADAAETREGIANL